MKTEFDTTENTTDVPNRFGYFYNEQGDYTLTLDDEPFAMSKDESRCMGLLNHIKTKDLRIDVLRKIVRAADKRIIEQREKYEQCLRDTKAFMERNYRVPSNYPVYKHIVSLLNTPI
jgi:hypothetical protein